MDTRLRAGWRWMKSAIAEPSERRLEALALACAGIAGVIVAVVALVVFAFHSVPIAGSGSIGQFVAVASAIVAIAAFVLGTFVQLNRTGAAFGVFDLIDGIALALAYAVISALTWSLLADILQRGFIDADVFTTPAVLIGAAVAAMTAYVVFVSVTHLDLSQFAFVLALFLVEGVIAATLSADDPHWWRDNLSALGMTGETSALIFNLTVIVGGVLVTALARYATRDLWALAPRGTRNTRIALIMMGCCLIVVGLVRVDVSFLVHTAFASAMMVVFAVLTVMIGRWIPAMPRTFMVVGWLFTAVIGVLVVFFAVGYYTLTAVEIIAGILIFTWIVLFIRTVDAVVSDAGSSDAGHSAESTPVTV